MDCNRLGGRVSSVTSLTCTADSVMSYSILVLPGASLTLLLANVTVVESRGVLVLGRILGCLKQSI